MRAPSAVICSENDGRPLLLLSPLLALLWTLLLTLMLAWLLVLLRGGMSDVITGSRTCFESQCCVSRRAGEERRWMCSGRLGKLLALSGNYERALVYIHAPWSCRYHLWASSSRLSLASHRTIGLIIYELNSISFPTPLPFYSYPCSLILLIF